MTVLEALDEGHTAESVRPAGENGMFPRLVTVAVSVYPDRWRREYEAEVTGTLLDVADARGRSASLAGELLVIWVRGLWVRARTSIVFWGGLLVIGALFYPALYEYFGFATERYWPSVHARAAGGLRLALPIAGGIAAWLAWNSRARYPASRLLRLRQLLRDSTTVVAFVAVGYLSFVVAILVTSGWPATSSMNAGLLAALLAQTLTAIAVGYLVGSLFHPGFACLLSVAAVGFWLNFASVQGALDWRNVNGYNLIYCCDMISTGPSPETVAITIGIAIFVGIVTVVVAALSSRLTRMGAVATTVALLLAATPQIEAFVSKMTSDLTFGRNASELVCAGNAPEICLWPEQEAQAGPLIRSTISTAQARGREFGLGSPTLVSAQYTQYLEDVPHFPINFGANPTRDEILINYSVVATAKLISPALEKEDPDFLQKLAAAQYAAAILLDASEEAALPDVYISGGADDPGKLTDNETRNYLDVHSMKEAKEVLAGWVRAMEADRHSNR